LQRSFLLVKPGEVSVFTTTKDRALLTTTTTGALPRPSWYTENLRGKAYIPATDKQLSLVPLSA
jgi:hypothetical protein